MASVCCHFSFIYTLFLDFTFQPLSLTDTILFSSQIDMLSVDISCCLYNKVPSLSSCAVQCCLLLVKVVVCVLEMKKQAEQKAFFCITASMKSIVLMAEFLHSTSLSGSFNKGPFTRPSGLAPRQWCTCSCYYSKMGYVSLQCGCIMHKT